MSEMVERVVRAIDPIVEELCKERGVSIGEIRDIARAAIEAMREPTDAMLNAADPGTRGDAWPADTTWKAMIDKALK